MKKTKKLKIIRGCTTVFFASFIFICGLFPRLNIQSAAAVISGSILGCMQGAGSAGIYIIAMFILSGFSMEHTENFAAVFSASFISGLAAGFPSIIEKKIPAKSFLRIALGCAAGFFAYSFIENLFHKNICWIYVLPLDLLKSVGITILSIAIRPKIASFLFPINETEDEIEEIIKKLKKKNNTQ